MVKFEIERIRDRFVLKALINQRYRDSTDANSHFRDGQGHTQQSNDTLGHLIAQVPSKMEIVSINVNLLAFLSILASPRWTQFNKVGQSKSDQFTSGKV